MPYDEILRTALAIALRRPWLWVMAFVGGEYTISGGGSLNFNGGFARGGRDVPYTYDQLQQWFTAHLAEGVTAAMFLGAAAVVWLLLSCAAEAAVVEGVAAIDGGQLASPATAARRGLTGFGRVLALRIFQWLVVLLPLLAYVAIVIWRTAALGAPGLIAGALIGLPLLFLEFFLVLGFGIINPLATRVAVLQRTGPLMAYRRAWAMAGTNLTPFAIFTGILFGAGIIVGTVTGAVYALLLIPLASPVQSAFASGNLDTLWSALRALVLGTVVITAVLSAPCAGYWSAAWTLAYRRLGGAPPAWPPSAAVS